MMKLYVNGTKYTNVRLYCDMDGVLANFIKGANTALRQFDTNLETSEREGKTWKYLNLVPDFFRNLEPLPDMKLLWSSIQQFDPYILSARPKTLPEGKNQKIEWLAKHIPSLSPQKIIICLKKEKANYAVNPEYGNPNLLIDDDHSNVKRFRLAGGIAILHTSAKETLKQLKDWKAETYP